MTTHHALILLLDTHESQYTSYYLLRGEPFVSTTNHALILILNTHESLPVYLH